jgi:hypothetical protein
MVTIEQEIRALDSPFPIDVEEEVYFLGVTKC